ncbi:uncharacterized protein VTP21DRAFT_2013 [Calcarisporiella thermophila]|uniref:uncharacterized protein n=1 Tax=Calcarisporiella thermophila TaxID=911321 RepID=UPI0037430C78
MVQNHSITHFDDPKIHPSQAENPFINLVSEQHLAIVPEFTLESGVVLHSVPVAYKTWGRLSEEKDNVMVICHALSGSADVEDWWGPLIGPGRAFDPNKWFIFCGNVLGSPYGTASPVTINPETGKKYGPEFPLTSVRDDVRLHRMILESLGVSHIAICIGGSLGGMQVLEWSAFGADFVKNIAPIATSARHSAWGISWGEAQRQSIYSDPNYCEGYYTPEKPPSSGLAAARMSALLTYRSRNSFESRFGRNTSERAGSHNHVPSNPAEAHVMVHNDGHHSLYYYIKPEKKNPEEKKSKSIEANGGITSSHTAASTENKAGGPSDTAPLRASITAPAPMPIFSAQSYLRYQGDKFVKRFDANCYIAITRKMDTHDVGRGRGTVASALSNMTQPALVIGIDTDGLFTISEQYEIAEFIPKAEMVVIQSPDGHDGFLLEFDQINRHLLRFIRQCLPQVMDRAGEEEAHEDPAEVKAVKTSLFGEAEVDMMKW